MMAKHVVVTAGGLVSSVGFNVAASCAAVRAGIRGVAQTNLFDPNTDQPIPAGRVELPQWWEGHEKLAELVSPAIDECLATLPSHWCREDVPILLGVAAIDRPHRFAHLEDRLLGDVEFRLRLPHHPLSGIVPRGHVSGALAIRRARTLVEREAVPACVVACVDSLLRQRVVNAYAERRRIMTADNSNGFFPAEAGSAVLVTRSGELVGPQLEILGAGFGSEAATIDSTQPCRGEGLTKAIREAVREAGIDFQAIAYRVNDLNGEHYKFKEASIAVSRMETKPHHQPFDMWHPNEFLGEVGAAIGPAALTIALTAGAKGYAPGDIALFHFSNDDGERAALVTRYLAPWGHA